MPEKQVRLVTVGEYIAEELEAEANRMPPSYKDQADTLAGPVPALLLLVQSKFRIQ